MRPELGAQITLSFLAHLSIFFVANQFLNSSEFPRFDIAINTTQITDSSITVFWKITKDSPNIELVKSAYVSIYSLEVEDLTFRSRPFNNITYGEYRLTNLQPKMKYNICIILRTLNEMEVSKCVGAKTGTMSTGSRFKLLHGLTSTGGGHTGQIIFYLLLVGSVFFGASYFSYQIYNNALSAGGLRRRGENVGQERNYVSLSDMCTEGDEDDDDFDVNIRRQQMEEPLITAEDKEINT